MRLMLVLALIAFKEVYAHLVRSIYGGYAHLASIPLDGGAPAVLDTVTGQTQMIITAATQTLPQSRPKWMAVTVEGQAPADVTAKDIVLAIIGRIGTGGGIGHVIEYRGSAIRALSMEGRMTLCNMSIEAGARAGMVAPDDVTF